MARSEDELKGTGWIYFASVMMFLAGLLHGVQGLVALFKHTYYVVTPNALIAFDYTTWGWIHIILAVVLVTAASSALVGGYWGRTVGVLAATLSIVANMAFLSTYPLWSLMVIVIDFFVIYAMIVKGGALRPQ